MKKKTEPVAPQRVRRSNSELLPMPREALRRIKEVAEQSCMPAAQVYADVLRLGLLAVKPMYAPMISFRQEAERRWEDEARGERTIQEPATATFADDVGQGVTDPDVRERSNGEDAIPSNDLFPDLGEERSGDAALERGLRAQDEATTRLADAPQD